MAAISPELEQFVEQEVASGRYADRDAVIAHGLALLRRDREEAVAGIAAGLADVAAASSRSIRRSTGYAVSLASAKAHEIPRHRHR